MRRYATALEIFVVFSVAVICRFIFNAFMLEHRICQFGDAYYYLNAGSQLLQAMTTGHVGELIKLYPPTQGIQAMTSTGIVDRLLLDGPVFPSYLALMLKTLGVTSATPQFDAYAVAIGLFNSVADSISCVLIYLVGWLAFSRRVGLIAGLLFAIYPPAVVNTALCYSEQFAYLIMLLWTVSVLSLNTPTRSDIMRISKLFLCGLLSILLLLSKPIFVLLPPLAFLTVALPRLKSSAKTPRNILIAGAVAFVFGFALVAVPWMQFTYAATGKPSLLVNRAPAFNLFIGNDLASDGFRTYPLPYVPCGTQEAIHAVALEFVRSPVEFVALQLRKTNRLWSGAWNTFGYSFLVDNLWQDIWHQSILLFGALGAAIALSRQGLATRRGRATILLCVIVATHCAYLAFEPISRYAMTAMPFLCILTAYFLSRAWPRSSYDVETFVLSIGAVLAFLISKRLTPTLVPAFDFLPGFALPYANAAVWLSTWTLVSFICWRWIVTVADRKPPAMVIGGFVFITVSVSAAIAAQSLGDTENMEWGKRITSAQPIERTVTIGGKVDPTKQYFLLADLRTADLSPGVVASVNGRRLQEPTPWWQVYGDNSELVKALSLGTAASGTNIQNLRQWWAFPVPADYLQNNENVLELQSKFGRHDSSTIVFGEYIERSGFRFLPSLDRASWTKAFATIVRGDARLRDKVAFANDTAQQASPSDSGEVPNPTPEKKEYHLYLIAVDAQGTKVPSSPLVLFTEQRHDVSGTNPLSFFVCREFRLPARSLDKRQRIVIAVNATSSKNSHNALLVSLTGTLDGKAVEWSSLWQPGYIKIGQRPESMIFGDSIPADLSRAEDTRATIMISPFPAEWIFLKRKQAIQQAATLTNIEMRLEGQPRIERGTRLSIY